MTNEHQQHEFVSGSGVRVQCNSEEHAELIASVLSSGLDAVECLERIRRFMHDELDRIQPVMERQEYEHVSVFAGLVEQLIDDILPR